MFIMNSKELFILEAACVLHTPLLPEKMRSSGFLLCCDVEKCTRKFTGLPYTFETVFEIIGLAVLNLASSYSGFFNNNPRSNSEMLSSMK